MLLMWSRRYPERRRFAPTFFVQVGVVVGLFLGALVEVVHAQGLVEAWNSPTTLMSLGGLLFSAGMAYHLVTDTRQRQDRLEARQDRMEESAASKAEVGLLRDDIKGVSEKLDRLIERRG